MTPCEIFSRAPLGTTKDLVSRKMIVQLPSFTVNRSTLIAAPLPYRYR